MSAHQKSVALLAVVVACGGNSKPVTITNTINQALPLYLLAPDGVSFEIIHDRCQKSVRHFCLENHAAVAVHFTSLKVDEDGGASNFAFGAIDGGLGPDSVQGQKVGPATRFCFDVEHKPQAPGVHSADLSVGIAELATPLTLAIGGGADFPMRDNDDFFEGPQVKLDILFVIDKSSRMMPFKQAVHDRLLQLFDQIDQRADFHIGVVSAELSEAGQFHPRNAAQRIFASDNPAAKAGFEAAINGLDIGAGTVDNGLTAAFYVFDSEGAGTDFFRDEAATMLIFVSDDDDSSAGDPQLFASYYRAQREAFRMKPGADQTIFLPVRSVIGGGILAFMTTDCSNQTLPPRYTQAISILGGFPTSLCNQDWSQVLGLIPPPFMSQQLVLSRTPKMETLRVTLKKPDGTSKTLAASSDWTYDPSDRVLTLAALPDQKTTVEASYETQCQ